MLENLLSDHEVIIKTLRKNINECQDINDEGTANFLTDKMEEHEKMAWMLRELFNYKKILQQQKRGVINSLYVFIRDNPRLLIDSINTLERKKEGLREKAQNYR